MRSLMQRINKLDETIQSKISQYLGNDNNQVVVEFNKVERLCRDRGELYGYSRLVDRDTIDEDNYKIVAGRIRHLEMCHREKKEGTNYAK